MRFFDHITTIKKLLFFQNRSILEQICTLFHEPMGATWKVSTIIDFVSRDPLVDQVLLKNVILKPYKGVIMDFSLSYGVEWPMSLTISNRFVEILKYFFKECLNTVSAPLTTAILKVQERLFQ